MRKRRPIELFSISFLDLLSGALGAVIILYVAIPKNHTKSTEKKDQIVKEAMQKELADSQEEVKRLQTELAKSKPVAEVKTAETQNSQNKPGGADLDIGFKFKGRNIVFLIDTSHSMTEEDRMGQVKAGLKMLITSLSPHYKIDIVQYPLGERAPFKSLWGDIKETTPFNKNDAYEFVYRLRPSGGTPTRDALLFVLQNYETTTDIVLLTDGAPTLHNSNQKDDIYDILKVVREENPNKIQINSIGVGSDFIRDKMSERYKFLSLLSEQNNGFFVGF
jgi:uncharacterized protein YegL